MSELDVSLDTFHFLADRLQITPESKKLEKEFKHFAELPKNTDKYWLELMEDFGSQFDKEFMTNNTYNGDSALDQTLQYTVFDKDGKSFVILQIHGGADIRGGYTDPYIFEIPEKYTLMEDNFLCAHVGEGDTQKSWTSDSCGYNWEYDGESGDTNDEGPFPENWAIRSDGVYYRPTGELIDFGNEGIVNGQKAPERIRLQKTGTYKDLSLKHPKEQKALKLSATVQKPMTKKHAQVSVSMLKKAVPENKDKLKEEELKIIAEEKEETNEEKERLRA